MKRFCYVFSLIFLLCACSDHEDRGVTPPDDGKEAGRKISLSFASDPLDGMAATRADITDNYLDDIWLLIYDASGIFLESYYTDELTQETEAEGSVWKAALDIDTPEETEVFVYCLGNTHDNTLFAAANVANFSTVEKLKGMALTLESATAQATLTNSPEGETRPGLLMRGVGRIVPTDPEDDVIPGIDEYPIAPLVLEDRVWVQMYRLVSRIDFSLENVAENVRIDAIQLKNVPSVLGYMDTETSLTSAGYEYTYIDYPVIENETDPETGLENTHELSWYIPRHVLANHTVASPETSTCIEVIGSYMDEEYNERRTRSYRFYPNQQETTNEGEPTTTTYNFNLDANHLFTFDAVIEGHRVATLDYNKFWSVEEVEEANVIKLRSDANCIVVPSQKYETGILFAFDIAPQLEAYAKFLTDNGISETIGLGESDAWTASPLWQESYKLVAIDDTRSKGTGPKGRIYFTLSAKDVQGNALIELKKGSTTIWSWHLWVLNHDPGTTTYTPNNTDAPAEVPLGTSFTILNYNLGATMNTLNNEASWGLSYQWGRKDPFPRTGNPGASVSGYFAGSSGSIYTIPGAISPADLDNRVKSIQYPGAYIVRTSDTRRWVGSDGANSWGNGSLTTKTVFDPCPAGYHVPNPYVWGSELSNTENNRYNSGYDWTTITGGYKGSTTGPGRFFITGLRMDDGRRANLSNGYCWSSVAVETLQSGVGLAIGNGTIELRKSNNSINFGFPVRCTVLH